MKKDNIEVCDKRTILRYDLAVDSNIGKRESQQDAAYVTANDSGICAVICDGMGGMQGGETASATAVAVFKECYTSLNDIMSPNQWMQYAIGKADDSVHQLTDNSGNHLCAGTTLIAVSINGRKLSWVSVGDSRIYIFRNDEMVQITTDHNYYLQINEEYETGLIDQEKYLNEAKQGEALLSYIGMGGVCLTDINEVPFSLMDGDTILLCTDGVYRTLPEDCLQQIMMKCKNMQEASCWIERYIKEVNMPYQDNYTYILIRICKGIENGYMD